ncbi:MAG: hypothetical protein IK018_03310 [Lachnospiraceae bacterium]|nr:hypothetical protein [Lachnospiraceae bacterium]
MKNNVIKLLSLCLVLALCAGCTKDSAGSASVSSPKTPKDMFMYQLQLLTIII